MACGWLGERREGNYLLGEPPSVRVAGNSPSTGTEASHCSQWSRGNGPVALILPVLIRPKLDFVVARARTYVDFSPSPFSNCVSIAWPKVEGVRVDRIKRRLRDFFYRDGKVLMTRRG